MHNICERTWLKKSIKNNIKITLTKLGNSVHGFQKTFKSISFWNVQKEETADVKCKMFLSVVLKFRHWHQIARLSDDRLPQLTQRSRIKPSWLLHPHILILTSTYRQVIYLPSPFLARVKHWIGRGRRLNNHVTRLTESRLSGLLSGLRPGVEAVNGGCAGVKHILWLREWSVRALPFRLLSWSCNEASGTMLRALHLTQRAFLALFTLGTLFTVCVGALTGKLIPVTPQLVLKRKHLQQNHTHQNSKCHIYSCQY